jgi:uncharacterized membrane protein YoaK (UPF0700 family)
MALLAVAGVTDAIGFLKLTHLFVSFMSGNSTQFAIAATTGDARGAVHAGVLVAAFVCGAMGGRAVVRTAGSRYRSVVLVIDATLLVLAALLPHENYFAILPLPFAMGMQNVIVRHVGQTSTNLTYVTGTLIRFAEAFVDALFGERSAWLPYALMWLCIILGAVVGTVLFRLVDLYALFVPAAMCLVLAAFVWRGAEPAESV